MRFNSLEQWLDWQTTLHPKEIELGLERVASVWQRLKPAGLQSLVVTVAGTNGKGSSVAMLESIYRQGGYRVGAYTSPHLVRYNERIRIDGREVSDEALCLAFEQVDQARGETVLTYFEFATLAALMIFAEQPLDLVILEVGLGGRLDAVNIIDADLALITTVDLDHTDWLGNSREEIGLEKAGIMRPKQPVVVGDSGIPESVPGFAKQIGAELYLAGRDFNASQSDDHLHWQRSGGEPLTLPLARLTGHAQLHNTSAVVMVTRLLQSRLPLQQGQLSQGLRQVSLQGRMQLIEGRPTLLLDVAHNAQAVTSLRRYLDRLDWPAEVYALFGLLKDKDTEAIVECLHSTISAWYLVDLPGARGQSAEQLARVVREHGEQIPVHCFSDFSTAFDCVKSHANAEDLIVIFGSFLIVGDALDVIDPETQ
ncbi:MAG: bifunctional tetrahydrofolate synthase/dihydrofolate synthase [Candidatus Thiodiazotropha endolucinida]|nr:bifunctional tetrahydrofolate synthase/dihydrofolate synthase [Candidatus Thiodiazotropha taylori]MCG8055948.1 bifunctional tetrahydrofolate synthase/dihydrofolate synthase [Candidatus Thiodiazotropha taylori]MCW4317777.1 bifunctional tetrahydrofolate synthase/dihydrofolate synthase [Candidatus Thiodiazotropha taylori]MCW4321183.1 bifunctional tetrahydrofolate synthase/dihydrofolate synthase [Candidatus Thiodiazotropha taylori]